MFGLDPGWSFLEHTEDVFGPCVCSPEIGVILPAFDTRSYRTVMYPPISEVQARNNLDGRVQRREEQWRDVGMGIP